MDGGGFVPGALKLKGAAGVSAKKKKKSKKTTDALGSVSDKDSTKNSASTMTKTTLTSSSSEPVDVVAATVSSARRKTEAELKFEEIQRKRLEARAEKIASKSHKERVVEFNKYLESLSEHHDIPRVGPG